MTVSIGQKRSSDAKARATAFFQFGPLTVVPLPAAAMLQKNASIVLLTKKKTCLAAREA